MKIAGTISAFVLAMVWFPEAQAKAQAELDAVVGPCILPTFAEEQSLPYVSALVREVLRWRPVAAIGKYVLSLFYVNTNRTLGVPHKIEVEDEYKGYRIPAGSRVLSNIK